MEEFITAFLDPKNIAGHISYMLLIVSMMMRTMHWLRAVAISAGLFSALYYFSIGDQVSLFWESTFVLVNVIQLLILFIENRRGRFSADEQRFIDHCLKDVERIHVRKLMKLGSWTEIGEGMELIREGSVPDQLIYVVSGEARVEREGRKVGKVGVGDFLGEMSYLTRSTATATVVTDTKMRYLAFDRKILRDHLSRNAEIRHAMEAGFNRNLVEKLAKTSFDLQIGMSGMPDSGRPGLDRLGDLPDSELSDTQPPKAKAAQQI